MIALNRIFSFSPITPHAIATGIFVLALALRLVFAFQWHGLPYGDTPLWDAKGHDDWALQITQGHFLQGTAFYASPVYPYFLALIYALFGHGFLAVSLVNAVIDSLTCVLLVKTSYEGFGAGAAILTGLLAALYRSMIFYSAPVLKESLGLFLLAGFTLLILRALRDNRMRDFAGAGFLLGLCALVRGNVLLLAPAAIGLVFLRRRSLSAAFKQSVLLALTLLLAVLPATIHNFIASRDFVLINYDDGFNFYLGHSPWATGISYDFPPFITADPRPEEIVETAIARRATGRQEISPSAISAYWRQQAFDYIRENKAHSVSVFAAAFLAFWSADAAFDNYDISFIKDHFPTILSAPLVSLWLIAPLAAFAALGLWRSRRHDEIVALLALAAAYMISVLLFYVTERYRLPVIIFLLPLAGAAAPVMAQARKTDRRLIAAIAVAFVMLGLTLWPHPSADLSAYDWATLGSIETDRGHYKTALQMIEKAMAIAPAQTGADGMIKASYAEQQLGHADQAAQWLAKARQFYPDNGVILYNIGRLQTAQGQWAEALDSFRQSIKLTPTYVLSYYAEALVEEKQGHHDEAILAAQRGLLIAPDDARLRRVIEQLSFQDSGTR